MRQLYRSFPNFLTIIFGKPALRIVAEILFDGKDWSE